MASTSKKIQYVTVEVLQNGEPLASHKRRLQNSGWIKLGKSLGSQLRLPFYPLSIKVAVAKVTRKGVRLGLDTSWEGFLSSGGKLHTISKVNPLDTALILKEGDYASLVKNDLRILIKVASEFQTVPQFGKDRALYRGSLTSLFLGSTAEKKGLVAGIFCASCIFGGLFFGLLKRPDDRPRKLQDLNASYVLPFIHPDHLRYLPETLQDNLDRRKPLNLAIAYYNEYSEMVIGKKDQEFHLLLPSTVERMERMHRHMEDVIRRKIAAQIDTEQKVLAKKGVGIVSIPAALGESIDIQQVRLQENIKVMHESLADTLKNRREMTKRYMEDSQYDFNEYRGVGGKGKSKGNEELAKINVFNQLTDEQMMYLEAEKLAVRAERQQKHIRQNRDSFEELTNESARPLVLAHDVAFASFIPPEDLKRLDSKLELIQAAQFGVTQKKAVVIKEPLLGEIDPRLIEKTISRNRFELQLCFELALRRNQNLKGTMKWHWRLDSRGKISDLRLVETSIPDTRMKNCVKKKIANWRFPRPRRGSVEITYPFHFKPAKG